MANIEKYLTEPEVIGTKIKTKKSILKGLFCFFLSLIELLGDGALWVLSLIVESLINSVVRWAVLAAIIYVLYLYRAEIVTIVKSLL